MNFPNFSEFTKIVPNDLLFNYWWCSQIAIGTFIRICISFTMSQTFAKSFPNHYQKYEVYWPRPCFIYWNTSCIYHLCYDLNGYWIFNVFTFPVPSTCVRITLSERQINCLIFILMENQNKHYFQILSYDFAVLPSLNSYPMLLFYN